MSKNHPTTETLIKKLKHIDRRLAQSTKRVRRIGELLEKAGVYNDVKCPYCAANLKVRLLEGGEFELVEYNN